MQINEMMQSNFTRMPFASAELPCKPITTRDVQPACLIAGWLSSPAGWLTAQPKVSPAELAGY